MKFFVCLLFCLLPQCSRSFYEVIFYCLSSYIELSYFRVLNKQTDRLLGNEKRSHLYFPLFSPNKFQKRSIVYLEIYTSIWNSRVLRFMICSLKKNTTNWIRLIRGQPLNFRLSVWRMITKGSLQINTASLFKVHLSYGPLCPLHIFTIFSCLAKMLWSLSRNDNILARNENIERIYKQTK